jgi:hypothetical protein
VSPKADGVPAWLLHCFFVVPQRDRYTQGEGCRYPGGTGKSKEEFIMMARHGNEMGSIGTRGKRLTAMRRPLLVGALTAGVVALGVSTAVAVGPLGDPSPAPSTSGGQGTSMMSGTGTMGDMGSGADMKTHMGSGADMKTHMGSGADMKTHMGSGADMMRDKGTV